MSEKSSDKNAPSAAPDDGDEKAMIQAINVRDPDTLTESHFQSVHGPHNNESPYTDEAWTIVLNEIAKLSDEDLREQL